MFGALPYYYHTYLYFQHYYYVKCASITELRCFTFVGSINYSQSCHKMDETIPLSECSKYYLQLNMTSVVFQPKFDDCSADYQDIQTSIINLCNEMDNSDICIFNLSDISKTDRKCFQSNRLLIEYTCDGKKTTFKANTFFYHNIS